MFPYFIPIAIGVVLTTVAARALANSERYRRRWPWIVVLVAALVLWIPALVLFTVVPTLWPSTMNGQSAAYMQLMGWQVFWIFLCLPPAFIVALVFTAVGFDGRRSI